MSKAIGWYVTELRLLLAPHLQAKRLLQVCMETESHLEQDAERHSDELGVGAEEAAWLAIEAFGKPQTVAQTYVRESGRTVFGMKPHWAIFGGSVAAIASWDFHWLSLWGPFDNFGETWQNGIAGGIGVVALVLFALGCRASFRWNGPRIGALSVATALVLVPALSMWIVTGPSYSVGQQGGVSRWHLARDKPILMATLSRLDALENYLIEGKKAFAQAKSLSEIPEPYRNLDAAAKILGTDPGIDGTVMGAYRSEPRFIPEGGLAEEVPVIAPRGYNLAMYDGRIYALETRGYSDAKARWANTRVHLQFIKDQRSAIQGTLQAVDEAAHGRLFFPNPWLTVQGTFWTISMGVLLILLDTGIWLIVRRRKARPGMALA